MKYVKKAALVLFGLALIAGCALLPTGLALWQDSRQLDETTVIGVEPVALDADTDLIDRLRLASMSERYCEVRTVEVGTGVRLHEPTVFEQAKAQLGALYEAGILTMPPESFQDCTIEAIDLAVDMGDPSNSGMFWHLVFYSEDGQIVFLLDDESGLIVYFEIAMLEEGKAAPDDLAACGRAWAEYLGLTVAEDEVAQKTVEYAVREYAEMYGYDDSYYDKYNMATGTYTKDRYWSYGGVNLCNADDPEGLQVTYLFRASPYVFRLFIA